MATQNNIITNNNNEGIIVDGRHAESNSAKEEKKVK